MSATPRRRARELVLQGLYERQLAGNADDAIAAALFEHPEITRGDTPVDRRMRCRSMTLTSASCGAA